MSDPICFSCKHFRQYQPLTFVEPGECKWQPDAVPAWLEPFIDSDDPYGPNRAIRTRHGYVITRCATWAAQLPKETKET